MTMGQEIELKLAIIDLKEIEKILENPLLLSLTAGKWQKEELLSTYYDTQEKYLMKSRLTFRVRKNGDAYEATVKDGGKSNGGLHERQEWNVAIAKPNAEIADFCNTVIYPLLMTTVKQEALSPLFATEFFRHKLLVDYGVSQIEVAVDQGHIVAGGQKVALAEVELELKQGQPADLIHLGAALAGQYHLRLEKRSKFQRGMVAAGLPVAETRISGEDTLALLLAFAEAEVRFSENSISRVESELVFQLWDKFRLRLLKQIGSWQSKSRCLEIVEQIGTIYQPLREVNLMAAQLRRLGEDGKITACYHKDLGTAFRRHRQAVTEKLVLLLQQGKTTPLVLYLWSSLMEHSSDKEK